MDNINNYTQAFDKIAGSANKLQTICKLAINTSDYNKPDMQTILYMIQDYVSDIKKISDIMV